MLDIQRSIGSDIMMILDECPPADCGYDYAAAQRRTHAQLGRQGAPLARSDGPALRPRAVRLRHRAG
ncbi:MAG: queuine tRNA-ribosyltransferase family protein [Ignavibacteriales bacterium]|nr:queuine tRNA-ribosyltransferase family protein [Ignavibacteriales bacterium]